ncbi:hypothetical protein HFP15_10235 [Amycolatopsis sp. K13G38]|uniref:Uncharacterized protein n=1 Tax=Amycolatopsis acididurans TaxID=2724524 RepID=A0ABX1J4I6_9PSEU|nr:hypothetical protein [Amycolatopsis acididurans]NKQ53260.1 hypothetical protein [Amycolatopsis acididurans]
MAGRIGLGVLLGIAGAFVVTALSWLASSTAASAEEDPAPPLVNLSGTGETLDLVHDTVRGTVDTVTAKVLPPPVQPKEAGPAVDKVVDETLGQVDRTVSALSTKPAKHRSAPATAERTVVPAGVPAPPPDRHVIQPPVKRPPVPIHVAAAPAPSAPPAAEHHAPAPGSGVPHGPVVPGPGPGLPAAPAPSGGAGSTFHAPDTPVFDSGVSRFWAGQPTYRMPRRAVPVVFRTVNAQPGVTPD